MLDERRRFPPTGAGMWPDWSGGAVAIVASGPSTKKPDVELLRGRLPVLAIKKNVELAPWCDVVYGCDGAWWESVRGLPEYSGLKLAWEKKVCERDWGIRKVEVDRYLDNLVLGETGVIGAGGNSGFQALNLALQFGARRILLIGFDMHDRSGAHWYGRNNWINANNPTDVNFRRWKSSFANAAGTLQTLGVEVVNAAPFSDLQCFKKQSVAKTLEAWGI